MAEWTELTRSKILAARQPAEYSKFEVVLGRLTVLGCVKTKEEDENMYGKKKKKKWQVCEIFIFPRIILEKRSNTLLV